MFLVTHSTFFSSSTSLTCTLHRECASTEPLLLVRLAFCLDASLTPPPPLQLYHQDSFAPAGRGIRHRPAYVPLTISHSTATTSHTSAAHRQRDDGCRHGQGPHSYGAPLPQEARGPFDFPDRRPKACRRSRCHHRVNLGRMT